MSYEVKVYRNVKTKKEIYVIARKGSYTQVKYKVSGVTSWFFEEDFNRIFALQPE